MRDRGNNLEVVTTTSEKYVDSYGFTEEEVSWSLDEFGLSGQREEVRFWYDGFSFGKRKGIYNPWSIFEEKSTWTSSVIAEAVLDRLPTAKVLSEDNGVYVVSAEVFGKGIDMWLRSQGDCVEVME